MRWEIVPFSIPGDGRWLHWWPSSIIDYWYTLLCVVVGDRIIVVVIQLLLWYSVFIDFDIRPVTNWWILWYSVFPNGIVLIWRPVIILCVVIIRLTIVFGIIIYWPIIDSIVVIQLVMTVLFTGLPVCYEMAILIITVAMQWNSVAPYYCGRRQWSPLLLLILCLSDMKDKLILWYWPTLVDKRYYYVVNSLTAVWLAD